MAQYILAIFDDCNVNWCGAGHRARCGGHPKSLSIPTTRSTPQQTLYKCPEFHISADFSGFNNLRPLTGVTIFSLLLPVVWLAGSDGAWCLDMRSTNGMTRCYRPLQQKWRPPCATRGFVYVSLLCLHVRISWKRTSNYSPHKIKVLVSLSRRGENSGSKDSSIEGESWRESWREWERVC